jgi:hypothetical protein
LSRRDACVAAACALPAILAVVNNTVAGSGGGIRVGGGQARFFREGAGNVAVYSNLVYDNGFGVVETGRTGIHNSYRNNLVYRNKTGWKLQNGLFHTATVTAYPLFLEYSDSRRDLHLSGSSPAIGRATPDLAEASDIEGKPCNSTTGYNIGATQHQAVPAMAQHGRGARAPP